MEVFIAPILLALMLFGTIYSVFSIKRKDKGHLEWYRSINSDLIEINNRLDALNGRLLKKMDKHHDQV